MLIENGVEILENLIKGTEIEVRYLGNTKSTLKDGKNIFVKTYGSGYINISPNGNDGFFINIDKITPLAKKELGGGRSVQEVVNYISLYAWKWRESNFFEYLMSIFVNHKKIELEQITIDKNKIVNDSNFLNGEYELIKLNYKIKSNIDGCIECITSC